MALKALATIQKSSQDATSVPDSKSTQLLELGRSRPPRLDLVAVSGIALSVLDDFDSLSVTFLRLWFIWPGSYQN